MWYFYWQLEDHMKLCECKIGVLVCVKPDKLKTDELRIGHVVGLTMNVQNKPEVIPVVLFAGNIVPTPYHHSGLDLFTAY
jgi:hypothetical protein